jgi:hypothetical protein
MITNIYSLRGTFSSIIIISINIYFEKRTAFKNLAARFILTEL